MGKMPGCRDAVGGGSWRPGTQPRYSPRQPACVDGSEQGDPAAGVPGARERSGVRATWIRATRTESDRMSLLSRYWSSASQEGRSSVILSPFPDLPAPVRPCPPADGRKAVSASGGLPATMPGGRRPGCRRQRVGRPGGRWRRSWPPQASGRRSARRPECPVAVLLAPAAAFIGAGKAGLDDSRAAGKAGLGGLQRPEQAGVTAVSGAG
jgi:hypothetical protein